MPLTEPLGRTAVHLVVDMQRLFFERTEWHTPAMADILPPIIDLATRKPSQTLFSRFVVPQNAAAATGRWQRYYRRWQMFTLDAMDPGLVGLVEPLASLAPPGSVFDKPTYSLFEVPAFSERLAREGVDTLVFSGVETDVCVLATLLAAVDRGFRVVAVEDALASSDQASHRAMLDLLFPRMPDQIEIAGAPEVLAAWPD